MNNTIKAISLFSGAGGMDIGFENAGIQIIFANEIMKEAAEIQTFPDNYIFCGNKEKIYTQIGNAVPCKMAEAVAKAVINYLDSKIVVQ